MIQFKQVLQPLQMYTQSENTSKMNSYTASLCKIITFIFGKFYLGIFWKSGRILKTLEGKKKVFKVRIPFYLERVVSGVNTGRINRYSTVFKPRLSWIMISSIFKLLKLKRYHPASIRVIFLCKERSRDHFNKVKCIANILNVNFESFINVNAYLWIGNASIVSDRSMCK